MEEKNKNLVILGTNAGRNVDDEMEKIFHKLEVTAKKGDFKSKIILSKNPMKPVLVCFTPGETRNEILEKRKKKGALVTTECQLEGET
ncbi:hypothetical protein JTB14_018779 [Gonioctena quinquepunctata]|nr:hypothetical protein JTB14_018779 [Gonioctena quinquepunctata]